jgi:hypothetical protein
VPCEPFKANETSHPTHNASRARSFHEFGGGGQVHQFKKMFMFNKNVLVVVASV